MNLFIPIILIIVSIGTFITFIHPEYQNIKDLKKTKESYTEKIANASNIRKDRSKLATKKAELEKDDKLDRLNKFLPDHINNIELIVDIDRIAKEDNIRISNILLISDDSNAKKENDGVIEVSSSDKYESTQISFSFISEYNSLKNFIDNLRKSLRLLDVVSITLSTYEEDKEGNVNNNLQIDMTVRAYWLKNK